MILAKYNTSTEGLAVYFLVQRLIEVDHMLSYVKLLLIKHAKTPYRNNTYVNLPTTTLLLFPGLGLAINKYMTLSTDTSVGTMDEKKKKKDS